MDLTKSQHPNSMILASAKIEMTKSPVDIDFRNSRWSLQDLQDLGLARGIKISFSASKMDVKADNGTVPIKGQSDVKARVEFSLLERHIPLIGTVMAGLVNVEAIGGFEKEVKEEGLHLQKEGANARYGLKTQAQGKERAELVSAVGTINGKKNIDIVKEHQGTIEGNTFYCANLTADIYDLILVYKIITPPTAYRLTKGSGGVAQPVAMKLTNKRVADDGRTISRTFEFPYGFYDGDDSIQLKSKNETDAVADVPMSFEFSPHPDMVSDLILEASSLYRETQEL